MAQLLQKVKSKMFIFAHRKARGMLDGEYDAIFRGRSLDFDDLRAYVPGDEIRDIDWKATARHGAPLIKRYVAVRKQSVLLVADTGRNMAAVAGGGEPKKDIMVMALGVIGYLALKHNDTVGLVYGDADATTAIPARGTEGHLESILQRVDSSTTLEAGSSNLIAQLEYIAKNIRQRRLIFVVADEHPVSPELERLLRRLRAQHELLWLVISDADLAHGEALLRESFDVHRRDTVVSLLAKDPQLAAAYAEAVQKRREDIEQLMSRQAIPLEWLGHSEEVMSTLFSLLERQRRARR
ncbi:uncharacterized protein (DUF58 family) [Psychromicrobium silvestre]|uniref:Uncharacterized protein (DUF58 family) n=1 Tax=Psychromicrobium silvestre TaxID=1645614 RepID=A0A7Y9LRX5_9MICC|nr:DUF58 domain-containing protein [Psychromicrobium silvestre]NYE94469.1 uncharacterized protein (DUF58 family) [Psychromicrobium silvestre]